MGHRCILCEREFRFYAAPKDFLQQALARVKLSAILRAGWKETV